MYHRIVKQIVRNGFENLSRGDYNAIVSKFAPDAHFNFAGSHAMAADLHDVKSVHLAKNAITTSVRQQT